MTVTIYRRDPLPAAGDLDFSGFKVLILEPAVGPLRLVGDMLTRELKVGSARGVRTVPEAAKLLAAGAYNLLILDWSSLTDAPKLLRMLRSERSFNRLIPVVVASANRGERNLRLIRDAGADEYVEKPLSVRALSSRLHAIMQAERVYVETDSFFGPDRRRYRTTFAGQDKRHHANFRSADRRGGKDAAALRERRQGKPGFTPPERRASNVRAKITELAEVCHGLNVPQVLALRRLTLADPRFHHRAAATDLDDFFTGALRLLIDEYSFEGLQELAPGGFAPLLPPGSDHEQAEDRLLLQALTRHLFA